MLISSKAAIVRYAVPLGGAAGPFTVDVELQYQPIGFRWANNLKRYDAAEPRRFTSYYDSMSAACATTLGHGDRNDRTVERWRAALGGRRRPWISPA